MFKILKWIFIGYYHLLLAKIRMLNKEKRKLYNKRFNICKKCSHLSVLEQCEYCGCFMIAKTKVDEASYGNES
jgi:hypothetical protein